MESLKLYLRESYNELVHKVTWPSFAHLQSNTVLVIVSTIILAIFIAIMDLASKSLTDLIYGLNG